MIYVKFHCNAEINYSKFIYLFIYKITNLTMKFCINLESLKKTLEFLVIIVEFLIIIVF